MMTSKPIFIVDPRLPQKISTVVLELNEILLSEEFHHNLEVVERNFPQSNINGPQLSKEIKRVFSSKTFKIKPYTFPWYQAWRNKKVVARVHSSTPSIIDLTTYFLGVNDDVDYANTIGHEVIHCVDNYSPYWFGHGDNDPRGDELTASHFVGSLCASLYKRRRDYRISLAVKESNVAFNEALISIGCTDKASLAKFFVRGFNGEAHKDSLHTID